MSQKREPVVTSNDYFDRYNSQMQVIGKKGQEALKNTRVHIAGLGGLGNLMALFLSTLGVGYISANDPQKLALENLGRFVCGEEADVGRDKATVVARFLHRNWRLAFEPVVAGNESPSVEPLFEQADWIFSCANTVSARIAAARKAIQFRKPIIDLGVSDGRVGLAGCIKYWLPECADWSACPACSVPHVAEVPRNGEGLLFTVLAATSALAVHLFASLVTGLDDATIKSQNYITIEMCKCQIEYIALLKRRYCGACSNR